jgi:D-3-phosphoglycerate dehydrogenase / 2-oxoglutarate reductase
MMKILNVEPDEYSDEAHSILTALGDLVEENMERSELLERIHEFDILIVRLRHQVDAELMNVAPNLKVIVSATTGLDHIDMEYAARKNITVLSLRSEVKFLRSIPATAELTWGLLLALMRNIPFAHASVLAGEWQRDRFKGYDLAGKRLGILGLGRIGERVAQYGLAFGMRVHAYDPRRKNAARGVDMKTSMEALLRDTDVLSIHVPLNEKTINLVGSRELKLLPRGSYLVNTARGAVLDEGALLVALHSGHLAGAALDVLAGERTNESQSLIDYARTHSNLLLTPHIGGVTYESMCATEIFMANKLKEYYEDRIRA